MKKFLFYVVLLFIFSGLTMGTIINFGYAPCEKKGVLLSLDDSGKFGTYAGKLSASDGEQVVFAVHNEIIATELQKLVGKKVKINLDKHLHKFFYISEWNAFAFEALEEKDCGHLCDVVRHLLNYPDFVDKLREDLEIKDPSLLEKIRDCQKVIRNQQ